MRIHPTTGEVIEGEPIKDRRPFVFLYLEGIQKILQTRMRPTDYRVLLAVWSRSPLDGFPWDTAAEGIGQQLMVDQADVHRSLRRLVEAGLLERPVRGKVAFVRAVAWRGSSRTET